MMPNIHPIQLIYLSRFNIPNVKHAAGKGWEACNDLWPPSICFTGVAKCWESGGPQGYPPPPPPPSIPSPPFCQKKRGRPPFRPPLFLHRRPLLPHGKSLGGCLEPMKQLGFAFAGSSQSSHPVRARWHPFHSLLSRLSLSRQSLQRPAFNSRHNWCEWHHPSSPDPAARRRSRRSRSSARRRAARPFAGWRQRQIFGGAVTDTRPNERGGLGDG